MISQTQIIGGVMIAMTTETSIRKNSHLKPQAELGSKAKLLIGQTKARLRWCDKKPITSMSIGVLRRSRTAKLAGEILPSCDGRNRRLACGSSSTTGGEWRGTSLLCKSDGYTV